MPASIACAKAGVTTGEWGAVFREVFGEYRAPTGIARAARRSAEGMDPLRADVERISKKLGRRIKFLVGKPGLDGHSNGAEQIAVRARDAGMEVVYGGIRFTPAEIVKTALEEDVHVIGLSILSGSHVSLVRDVVERMKAAGMDDMPIVVGGIVPPEDERTLKKAGVAAVYTPKDYEINRIMADLVRIVENAHAGARSRVTSMRSSIDRQSRLCYALRLADANAADYPDVSSVFVGTRRSFAPSMAARRERRTTEPFA